MPALVGPRTLAGTGSTGSNTHTGVTVDSSARSIAFRFVVEAAGATPTVTFKVQGTLDDDSVSDANALWVDVPYITPATDTVSQATQTVTAVGATYFWLDDFNDTRNFRRFRLMTSANTNITYRGELFMLARND